MTPRPNRYLSAWERLLEIAPVFLSSDLSLRYGWSRQQAAAYLSRWKRQGLVRPLGGRSGVYFNLVVDANWETHLDGAVRLAMPAAVEIGAGVLHATGLTTQRAYQRDLALPYGAHAYSVEGVLVHERGRRWFQTMHPHMVKGELPRLTAPAALADILTSREPALWLPDPDDIWLDELSDQEIDTLGFLVNLLRHTPQIHWDPDLGPEENYERIFPLARAARKETEKQLIEGMEQDGMDAGMVL